MNRTTIIVLIIVTCIILAALSGYIGYKIIMKQQKVTTSVTAEQIQAHKPVISDIFAGREEDAIRIVKQHKVLSPEYMDAYAKAKEEGTSTAELEKKMVTIEELVNQQFLEKRFNMSFLKPVKWRALHLDTDSGSGEQIPDPQYEVYLDYQDESVNVGPVWIVDLEDERFVIPRNDMAAIFDQNADNYKEVKESVERPASVIRAIVSHKFDNGIDLGGVFLLHFLQLASKPGHENDRIIGWTVMHEFESDYSAYFQWVEKDEVRVAKFKFDWASKSLAPKGLLAIDLMGAGESMKALRAADIYPNDYTNELGVPRIERWSKKHPCRSADYKQMCTAFVKVLEQQEFINAMEWLLTDGKENGATLIDQCKSAKPGQKPKCRWNTRLATGENNPTKSSKLYEIDYIYELNGRENQVKFLVDSETETIKPLDKISQWAYYSVAPRM